MEVKQINYFLLFLFGGKETGMKNEHRNREKKS